MSRNFFPRLLISKMGVKMNLRIRTKYHATDPEKRLLRKSILKPYGYATAMPPAWELRRGVKMNLTIITKNI